jgi:hypothetical protein
MMEHRDQPGEIQAKIHQLENDQSASASPAPFATAKKERCGFFSNDSPT